eukprot:gene31293-40663_t
MRYVCFTVLLFQICQRLSLVACYGHQRSWNLRRSLTPNPARIISPSLFMSTSSNQAIDEKSSDPAFSKKTFDPFAALNYISATTVQWSLICAFLHLIQLFVLPGVKGLQKRLSVSLPLANAAVFAVFAFLALRSRIFSPLDNSRPSALPDDPVFKKRAVPTWMPPRLAFPIVWSVITVLRAASTVLVYLRTDTLLCWPVFAMALHLSLGDTWNTINNVENRLGTAAFAVLFVLASVLATVRLYYVTSPAAGLLLAPSAVWLGVATTLVHRIWRLNMAAFDGPSYLPSKEEGRPSASSWRFLRTSSSRKLT